MLQRAQADDGFRYSEAEWETIAADLPPDIDHDGIRDCLQQIATGYLGCRDIQAGLMPGAEVWHWKASNAHRPDKQVLLTGILAIWSEIEGQSVGTGLNGPAQRFILKAAKPVLNLRRETTSPEGVRDFLRRACRP